MRPRAIVPLSSRFGERIDCEHAPESGTSSSDGDQ